MQSIMHRSVRPVMRATCSPMNGPSSLGRFRPLRSSCVSDGTAPSNSQSSSRLSSNLQPCKVSSVSA
eukprot:3273248-Rhodomonas_salina.1